ncbi:hypothetical protein C0Q70_01777 [Pomacea canaliculata]|uniref:LRRCT domain-containing protein n=1 Tax=Pomacea canaliculata TaxID=400727 RepID=A0A2T7Q0F6_POMCA|nr:hypothetical protein C0Q70_01777 [Pomacea canaliculata]
MQKLRTVITVVTQFICLCTSRHLQEDQCWVATYNGELILSPCFDDSRCRCNNTTADCSSNNGLLTYVPRLSFDVQVFNFSSNNLSHIPDGFFSNVSQVWLLDLCQNGLTSLSPRAFQELQNLTTLLKKIDLSGNPFYCSCDIRWFKEWLSTRPKTFGNYGQEGYMCDNIPNTQVQLFRINDQACLLGHAAAALNIAVIIIVLIVFIISIVFFRYRWHLRLVIRKILMVFSPDYARSEWCQFELKYCQCCVMDRDEVLVLVLLHETESRDMTSAMFAVMKTTTYIEWADTVDARNSFWGRLSRALDCVINP